MIFEKRARSIAERFVKDNPEIGLDWQTLLQILAQFLPLLLGFCKKTPNLAERIKKPGVLELAALRRAIRNECDAEPNCQARRALRSHMNSLVDCCVAEAKTARVEEVQEFVDEATLYGAGPDLLGV